MKIQVKVTKEVLRVTENCTAKQSPTNCAVAYAIREIFPNAAVTKHRIYPHYHDVNTSCQDSIELPGNAIRFIGVFDKFRDTPKQRRGIQPISFEIDIPASIIDHINIDDIHRSQTLEVV